jgi:hypothetical protein
MFMQALNDDGKKVASKTVTFRGKKVPLTVCRMVLQLDGPGVAWPVEPSALFQGPLEAAVECGAACSKRGKGKKGKVAAGNSSAAQNQAPSVTPDDVHVEGAVKVFVEEVSAVRVSVFDLKAIQDPIKNAGRYGTQL